jgi:aminoglycoside 6'-N-acetyltransferase I
MSVRTMREGDVETVRELMRRLWPDSGDYDFAGETVFVWDRDGSIGGFVSVSIRPWAQGCASEPVPYIEGWFVDEDLRRTGVGAQLLAAAEDRARAGGFTEIGSDAELDKPASPHTFNSATGQRPSSSSSTRTSRTNIPDRPLRDTRYHRCHRTPSPPDSRRSRVGQAQSDRSITAPATGSLTGPLRPD